MAEAETLFPSADRHQAELRAVSELERLPGAVAAAVWLTHDGQLREARIHTLPGAPPTIIANAASRVLQALNITFDARALRIVPVSMPDDVEASAAGGPGARFLLLQDLTVSRSGAHVNCHVQLVREHVVCTGEARELDTIAGRARASASATLRAAETATEGVALGLEGAIVSTIFAREYAVVSVEATVGRRVATLCGIVAVESSRSAEEAVCLATLRAIDRWIGL